MYIINEGTEIYDLMCSINAHEKQQSAYVDDCSRGGGNALISNLTR